jgi:hypothetical protein
MPSEVIAPATDDLAPRRALTVLRVALAVALFDFVVGGSWDAKQHETEPFDGFFSPAHIFIYFFAAVAMVLIGVLNAVPRLRDCFGATAELPLLGTARPAALSVLTVGFAGLALAGPLDAAWHTAFGLDETQWSLPHAMLGAALTVMAFGFVSCSWAMSWYRRPWPVTRYAFGYLLAFASAPYLGPLGAYATRDMVKAGGTVGALANDADYQHLVRVVVAADLTHANPAFPLLAAVWAGTVVALLRTIDPRARYWLVVAALVGVSVAGSAAANAERLGFGDDPAAVTPVPLLTAVLVFALARPLPEPARHALAGLALGLHALAVWGGDHPVGYLVAVAATPVAALAGAAIGRFAGAVVLRPAEVRSVPGALLVVLALPALTGLVDLVLRLAID